METKNQKVRTLVAEREYKKALQICKDWNYKNPTHSNILKSGYECLLYPDFYRQLGKSPEEEYNRAIEVLKENFLE